MATELTFDDIEQLSVVWTDEYARNRDWEQQDFRDQTDDLDLFFGALKGGEVLDVGCGWGRYVWRFLEQGLSYQGIDYSLEMLRAAREINPGSQFHYGTFRSLPFPSDRFDGLWSCCTLFSFPKKYLVEILSEHLRVMKVGGVMMIVMPHPPGGDSREEMYWSDDQKYAVYRSDYNLDEFEGHVVMAGFEILRSGYRPEHGSFYVLVRKRT